MAYKAMTIAAEVVSRYHAKGKEISNLKLQKVLYYIQMQALQDGIGPLIEEDFEAWRHGPVISDLYSYFRRYGRDSIPTDDKVVQASANTVQFCEQEDKVIGEIVEKTLDIQAWDLVDKTHETEPWREHYISGMNVIIPQKDIKLQGTVNL